MSFTDIFKKWYNITLSQNDYKKLKNCWQFNRNSLSYVSKGRKLGRFLRVFFFFF